MSESCVTQVMSTFATPVMMRTQLDPTKVNQALKTMLLEREKTEAGVNVSNVGGWHSRHDLLNWGGDEIAELTSWMKEAVLDMTVSNEVEAKDRIEITKLRAWANISRRGNFNNTHNHPNCDWSGVYYVAAGEPDPEVPDNGTIEFLDPRGGAVGMRSTPGQGFGNKMRITPHDGLMILFPSWLWHAVAPYAGPGERISIAFNASIAKRKAR